MGDVVKAGRTVLFVSHNLSAVGRLCPKSLLLSQGETARLGPTQEVLDHYLSSTFNLAAQRRFEEDPAKEVQIRSVGVRNHRGEATAELDLEHPFTTEITFEVKKRRSSLSLAWMLAVQDGTRVCESTDLDSRGGAFADYDPGLHRATVEFPGGMLNAGTYTIRVGIADRSRAPLDHQYGLQVHLHDHGTFATKVRGGKRLGLLLLNLPWQVGRAEGTA
jgi:lipopolysaccharide transport system ATP-binding protein